MDQYYDAMANYKVYVPKQGDKIDECLAKYINKSEEIDRIKVLFIRISEGVYQFGKRKINMKIEKDNQIYIKNGTGWMSLNEFIDKFTQIEFEKLEMREIIE